MNCLYTIQATGTATKFSSSLVNSAIEFSRNEPSSITNISIFLRIKTLLRFAIEGFVGTVTSIIRHAEDANRSLSSDAS
jgi:hypothetical protein